MMKTLRTKELLGWVLKAVLGLGIGGALFIAFLKPAAPKARVQPSTASQTNELEKQEKLPAPAPTPAAEDLVTVEPLPDMRLAEVRTGGGSLLETYAASAALIIRCEDYQDSRWGSSLKDPQGINSLSAALEKQGFLVREMVNPTGEELKNRLRNLPREFAQGDGTGLRVMVFFLGYTRTLVESSGEKLTYLAPVDAPLPESDNAGAFRSKAVAITELRTLAENLRARHGLFVVNAPADCSFVGGSHADVSAEIAFKVKQDARQFIIASSSGGETSWGPDHAEQFLDRFLSSFQQQADADGNQVVTGAELGNAVAVARDGKAGATNLVNPYHGVLQAEAFEKGEIAFQAVPNAEGRGVSQADEAPSPEDNASDRNLPQGPSGALDNNAFLVSGSLRMRWITEGNYHVKPTEDFKAGRENVPVRGFWMAEKEVSRAQFAGQMIPGPSQGSPTVQDTLPRNYVSLEDALAFCDTLNAMYKAVLPQGYTFRLPTEEEWEFAAGAGGKGVFRIQGSGLAASTTPETTRGQVEPASAAGINTFTRGLREWCLSVSPMTNAVQDWAQPALAVVRGDINPRQSHLENISMRYVHYTPNQRAEEVGFRIVLAPEETTAAVLRKDTLASRDPDAPAGNADGSASASNSRELFSSSSRYAEWNDSHQRGMLMKVQQALKQRKDDQGKSYYEGDIDGGFGAKTMEAIRKFQSDPSNNLEASQRLDDSTLLALSLDKEEPKAASAPQRKRVRKTVEQEEPGFWRTLWNSATKRNPRR